MNKTLIAMVAASMCATSAVAKTNIKEVTAELDIMKSIMQTSLRQSNDRQGIRFRSINARYLAKQGIVFEIATSGSSWQFSIDVGDILSQVVIPDAPQPPVHIVGSDQEFVVEFDDHEWQELAQEAMEDAREALRDSRDKLRDLREREREYAWEQREYERRSRDLEFEKRSADKERREEIESRSKELKTELDELKAKQEEVAKYAKEIEEEQKQQAAKRNEARDKQYKQFLAKFEDNIGNVMCRYGAGLKALPQDEHVTFILPNFGKDIHGKGDKDRIYVFNNKDIQSCVKDSINVSQLLQKAETYSF